MVNTNEYPKFFNGSYSQASQESFVLNVLKEKQNGYYVEVGGHHAFNMNNTYLLESKYKWAGVSLEIDQSLSNEYNFYRKNKCLNVDAITFNYKDYFEKNNFPKQIDYLQLDIDPAINTLACLKSIPLNDYRFSVITFETDLYRYGLHPEYQKEQQEILKSFNYRLVVENVLIEGQPFEDWWIDKSFVSLENYECFISKNIEHSKLFRISY